MSSDPVSSLPGKRWSRKKAIGLPVVALLAVFIWSIEAGRIVDPDPPGSVSCKGYEENINFRHSLFPKELSAAELCRLTPPKCGPTGMIFNPDGMETYYYQSQCYAELAYSTLDEEYCGRVVERRSLFLDGSYYSPGACRSRVRQFKLDVAAVKVGPDRIARIEMVETVFEPDEALTVMLALSPDTSVHGKYAIDAALHFAATGTVQPQRSTSVTMAMNPVHPAISHDSSYARLRPISQWVLTLSPALGNRLFVKYSVNDQMRSYFQRATVDELQLEVKLQFLESDDGTLADPNKGRDAYISAQTLTISLNTSGS